jgi:hypothetical protein
MTWHHWIRHKHRLIRIPPVDTVEQVIRAASPVTGQPTRRRKFGNVVASGPQGRVEFVVPGSGREVLRYLIQHSGQPGFPDYSRVVQ